MPPRILIAGEHGQLAVALARAFLVRDITVRTAGRSTMDIADYAAVKATVRAFQPNLIVNAAAYTAVDRAEEEATEAYRINRDGARHIALAARTAGIPLIHISTDYVFDGSKSEPYVEADAPNPLGVYGRSKLAGEDAVVAANDDFFVLRAGWIFSADGTNFVKTILRLAREREAIDIVNDQWGTPTAAADLAQAIVDLAGIILSAGNRPHIGGIYHAPSVGETTWFKFAGAIMQFSAARGGPSCRLRPIATSQYPVRARRPANSRLNGSKLAKTFGIRLPDWQPSLERCLDQLIGTWGGAKS